ncbi:ABC transporter permease [Nonomuraea lactucae]|uniref:ABC transporter permease n=1 Tax=Nonomuraea lactucae TaxID=2249762 RepID=UPI000DE28C6F|nr:ABC transporter permease [Nonomuraea lactucae]
MVKFLARRLLNYLVLVFLAASLAYGLAATALHPRANYEERNPRPPVAAIDATLSALNLNDKEPLLQRYGVWVAGVLRGDFGRTWEGDSINEQMGRRMWVSVRLLFFGVVLGSVAGVLVGAYSGLRQYKPDDRAITVVSFVVLAMPTFVLGTALAIGATWLNRTLGVSFLSITGESTPGLEGGFLVTLADRVGHLVVPTLTVALGQIAAYSRYQRSMMLDVLGQDYVRTALAKGLRRRTAMLKHALRTALIPVATFFAYSFGLLLVGSTFTEKIFGWHGMGAWFVDSVTRQDTNAVAAVSLFSAVLVLLAGLLSDVMYAALDPRVRVS